MNENTPQAQSDQKLNLDFNRWLIFLFGFTPFYMAVAMLLITLNIEELENRLGRWVFLISSLTLIYIILSVYQLKTHSTIIEDKTGQLPLDAHLASIRKQDPRYIDEIDILIEAMQKMHDNLKEKNRKLWESRAEMQKLARATLRSQETERRYISRELHDQAGQFTVQLHGLFDNLLPEMEVNALKDGLSPEQYQLLRTRLSKIRPHLEQTIRNMRNLSHKMRPVLLDVGDINLALQEYCEEFQEETNIITSYRGNILPILDEEINTALFRFLQEALTNVYKHAQATYVDVKLQRIENTIYISVKDNGIGHRPQTTHTGIGLSGMKERFNLLSGTVEIHILDDGFTIQASLPLSPTN